MSFTFVRRAKHWQNNHPNYITETCSPIYNYRGRRGCNTVCLWYIACYLPNVHATPTPQPNNLHSHLRQHRKETLAEYLNLTTQNMDTRFLVSSLVSWFCGPEGAWWEGRSGLWVKTDNHGSKLSRNRGRQAVLAGMAKALQGSLSASAPMGLPYRGLLCLVSNWVENPMKSGTGKNKRISRKEYRTGNGI